MSGPFYFVLVTVLHGKDRSNFFFFLKKKNRKLYSKQKYQKKHINSETFNRFHLKAYSHKTQNIKQNQLCVLNHF